MDKKRIIIMGDFGEAHAAMAVLAILHGRPDVILVSDRDPEKELKIHMTQTEYDDFKKSAQSIGEVFPINLQPSRIGFNEPYLHGERSVIPSKYQPKHKRRKK